MKKISHNSNGQQYIDRQMKRLWVIRNPRTAIVEDRVKTMFDYSVTFLRTDAEVSDNL